MVRKPHIRRTSAVRKGKVCFWGIFWSKHATVPAGLTMSFEKACSHAKEMWEEQSKVLRKLPLRIVK